MPPIPSKKAPPGLPNEAPIKSILIIEDEPDVTELYVDVLNDCFNEDKISIIAVDNGIVGKKHLENQKFDLIIADIELPGLDGISVIEKAAETGINALTPILVISGHVRRAESKMTMDFFSRTTFLEKPFKYETLIRLSSMCLQLKSDSSEFS